uniref:Uncharacterized protein n=1 Tax=Kalanchoe fedtschenkoi TaxID=63787 RepID=A0A7N0TBT2_KALFE
MKSYKTHHRPQRCVKHTTSLNYVHDHKDDSKSFLVRASASSSGEPSLESASGHKSFWESAKKGIHVFYRFSRVHAQVGTVFGIASMSLLAIENMSDFSLRFFMEVFKAMAVAFSINIYIAGLNQLTDVEIDKINKPYLPLASGEMSYSTGVLIVASAAIVNHVLQRPAIFPRTLIFAIAFVSLFAVVIALAKDIPDMEGDKKFGIQSFSVRLGAERVFWICVSIMETAYGVGICVSALSPSLWSRLVMVLGHTLLASLLWERANTIDLNSKDASQDFYMFVWKLLYAEYFLFPLMR